MRTRLSFCENVIALTITALLCAPQALAQMNDYTTDTEEPDIMTVKNDHCCDNQRLQEEANVELNVSHNLLTTLKPVKIQVFNSSHQEVANITTRDKVVYMHLPEGKYTINVNAFSDHSSVPVQVNDKEIEHFTI